MYTVLYQEADGPVQVSPGLTIVDVDDPEISAAIIELTATNVTLNFSVEIIAISEVYWMALIYLAISQSYGRLILNGIDRIEMYVEVLHSLTYTCVANASHDHKTQYR